MDTFICIYMVYFVVKCNKKGNYVTAIYSVTLDIVAQISIAFFSVKPLLLDLMVYRPVGPVF